MPDGDRVPLIQVTAQSEMLGNRIPKVPLPHLPHPLGQIIHNQAVLIGEELGPHLGDFPARQVAVQPLEERRVDQFFRQRLEQVLVLLMGQRAQNIEIANEHDGGLALHLEPAQAEVAVFHVVLEDRNRG